MRTFRGIYYDGQRSGGQEVEVELEPAQLVFRNLQQENGRSYAWNVYRIQPNDFNDRELTVLQYGTFPAEMLEVSDPDFLKTLQKQYSNVPFVRSRYSLLLDRGFRMVALLTLVFIGMLAGVYFWVLPKVAEVAAVHLPQHLEKQLGSALVNSLLKSEELDGEKTVYAQRFFRHLAKGRAADVTVTVVESDVTNAFAVPGGHIVVYAPMIGMSDSYEEFAGLLAHEYAHVQHRHSLRALFRNLSSYMMLSLVFGDVSGVMAVMVENANVLRSLEYSRELEREADLSGLDMLYRSGVDPQGMVRLFSHLKEKQGESLLPEFVSTHPLLDSRMKYLREEISQRDFRQQPNDSLQFYWQKLKE